MTNPEHGYFGCLYLYPLGVHKPLTEELLDHDVDISWWVTPTAYDCGLYAATHTALHHWMGHELPFHAPFYSNTQLPGR